MEKIFKALGLQAGATEDDAVRVINDLQTSNASLEKAFLDLKDAATPSKGAVAREKLVQQKMGAGLSREVAMEAIANQEREDALVAKREAKNK
jgi:hypothetical protein